MSLSPRLEEQPAAPTMTPSTGNRGTEWLELDIYGNWFTPEMTAAVSSSGIHVLDVWVVSGTRVFVGIEIAADAAPGPAAVTLTTAAGASAPSTLTVAAPTPTLASVAPPAAAQGASVPVTLNGTGFFAGATIAASNPGIAVSGVSVVSETQITATLTIAADAAAGAGNLRVISLGGTSGAAGFTVNVPGPALTSIAPAAGTRGTSVPVTLTGTTSPPEPPWRPATRGLP